MKRQKKTRRPPESIIVPQGEFLPPRVVTWNFEPEDQLRFMKQFAEVANNPGERNQSRIDSFIEGAERLKQEAADKANIIYPDSFLKPRPKRNRAWWELYDLADKVVKEAHVLLDLINKGDSPRATSWAIDLGRDAMLLQIRRAALDRRRKGGATTGIETRREADQRKALVRKRGPAWEESIAEKPFEQLAKEVSRKYPHHKAVKASKSIKASTIKDYLRRTRIKQSS